MRIVHLIYSLCNGGAENMLIDIVNEQSENAKVSLVVVNNLINKEIQRRLSPKVVLYAINRKPGSRFPGKLLVLNVLLLKLQPDIIHCHNHSLVNLIPFLFKTKIMLTVHDMNYPVDNLHRYHLLAAISDSVRDDIRSHKNLPIQRIYNGIHCDRVSKRSDAHFKGVFRIAQVGRLEHEKKGQHILLDALSVIRTMHPAIPISVDFIGNGSSYSFLASHAEKNNLSRFINFLGDKPRDWVYANLCNYDLVVQPSLYEGFGLTIVEAMAARVPVLVSNIQGPMEVICNGALGTSFEAENAVDFAKTIMSIIDNYDKELLQASIAYQYCLEHYSIKTTAKKYLDAYTSLTTDRETASFTS